MKKKTIKFNEKSKFYPALNNVFDPDVGIGIADMGLIYDVVEKNGRIDVTMTLTSMGCPAGPEIIADIKKALKRQKGIKSVTVEIVWDPPWTPDMMKDELREMMFGF